MVGKIVKIWLDDQRNPPEGWVHLHNLEEVENFVELISKVDGLSIDTMSFDFHLSDPKNGLDVMKYLADLCIKKNTKTFWPKTILYHSNDLKGVELMRSFAERFEKSSKSPS